MSEGLIQTFSDNVDFLYPDDQIDILSGWIKEIIEGEGGHLNNANIVFCDDKYLHSLNIDYLSHDTLTDIITFQYSDDPIEGELFISIDRVKENAIARSIDFQEELHRVIIHGILHLLGFKDKSQEEKTLMRKKEDMYLKQWKKAL